jgi:hypothetical protein
MLITILRPDRGSARTKNSASNSSISSKLVFYAQSFINKLSGAPICGGTSPTLHFYDYVFSIFRGENISAQNPNSASQTFQAEEKMMSAAVENRVARLFFVQQTKIYQITIKFTKWQQNIPINLKVYKISMKCTKRFHFKAF